MSDFEKELVYSEAVKAGKRIYYFDVKQSRNGDRYISITESKKIVDGSDENAHVSFEKHKLFLYKEDYDKFVRAFIRTLQVAKSGDAPTLESVSAEEPAEETAEETVAAATLQHCNNATNEPFEEETATDSPAFGEEEGSVSFKIDLDF